MTFNVTPIKSYAFQAYQIDSTPVPSDKDTKSAYIACNEQKQERTYQILSLKPRKSNGVHIGWACEANYNIIAIRNPRYAFICDIDPTIHFIYLAIREQMLAHSTVDEFKSSMEAWLESHKITSLIDYSLNPKEILKHFSRASGFLANQDSYSQIRAMYQADAIFHLNLNIVDKSPAAFQSIREWVTDKNCVVDTLYASNIVEWLKDDDSQDLYRKNLQHVMFEGTTSFIFAKRALYNDRPSQLVYDTIPQHFIVSPSKKAPRLRTGPNFQANRAAKRLKF